MSADDSGEDGAGVSRRDFVKAAGSIGVIAAASNAAVDVHIDDLWTDDQHHYVGDDYGEYGASDVIHTTCGQCNTFCPIKVRLADGSGTGEYSSFGSSPGTRTRSSTRSCSHRFPTRATRRTWRWATSRGAAMSTPTAGRFRAAGSA